jgi:hypothetical protein
MFNLNNIRFTIKSKRCFVKLRISKRIRNYSQKSIKERVNNEKAIRKIGKRKNSKRKRTCLITLIIKTRGRETSQREGID